MAVAQSEVLVRPYLEQMMIRFVSLGVPLEQATHELIEIEAHVEGSGVDPFEEFGDPQDFASSLVPAEQRHSLYRSNLRKDIVGGLQFGVVLFLAIQAVLSLFGEPVTGVPRLLLMFILACLYGVGQLAFSTILLGVSDDENSLRLRGVAQICLAAFVAVFVLSGLLSFAGADFSGNEPFVLSTPIWIILTAVALVIAVASFWRSRRLTGQQEILVEGGVTGQIIYEMNHNGFGEGWVRYGPNGEDLRDPDYSFRDVAKGVWRGITDA